MPVNLSVLFYWLFNLVKRRFSAPFGLGPTPPLCGVGVPGWGLSHSVCLLASRVWEASGD